MVLTRPVPARQSSLREHNLALVLGEVAASGPVSRARIAAGIGLTKATVSSLVDTLVGAGLVRELGPHAAAGVGRPGSALALATGLVGIGLEINVDYLATCTIDLTGAVRRRELVAEDFRQAGTDAVLARAGVALRAAVDDARASGAEAAEVCVAVPGLVDARPGPGDARPGRLRLAPNLGWRDVDVLGELARRAGGLDVPLRLDNEANHAALGELWCGRPTGDGRVESFLYVSGEIGVGAALVLDGALFAGTRGFAGEIGHLPLDAAGPPCRCGSRGCLELYAGQEAILRRAGLDATAGTATGRPTGPVDDLVTRAEAGDRAVLASIAAAGTALGTGVSVAVNLVDVDTVVLGGLYARLARWLREPVAAELGRRVLTAAWDPVRLLVGSLGAEAAVRGAALSAVRGVIDDPAGWIAARADAARSD